MGLFYWVEAGAGYALVGALPQGAAAGAGQAIYRQHPAPACGRVGCRPPQLTLSPAPRIGPCPKPPSPLAQSSRAAALRRLAVVLVLGFASACRWR